eukprot:CAMPEP_0198667526 /NCGR_PEP_ID=MMETSP1467-20131203/68934_1 /TAXON_ID=1462469 /ORGANISM="unid. sp., Strain CCMP2135" /LENGTH=160 /DNA_ID=CAMNT_0044404221 /DNA_START=151 /DNA_END=631 /DNA_ORIENTATION=-
MTTTDDRRRASNDHATRDRRREEDHISEGGEDGADGLASGRGDGVFAVVAEGGEAARGPSGGGAVARGGGGGGAAAVGAAAGVGVGDGHEEEAEADLDLDEPGAVVAEVAEGQPLGDGFVLGEGGEGHLDVAEEGLGRGEAEGGEDGVGEALVHADVHRL